MSECVFDDLYVYDTIYTSEDLLNWPLKKNVYWGDGAEPLTSLFYNKHKKCYTIREPFISGVCSRQDMNDTKYNLVWVSSLLKCDDGSINIYASASELEHGEAFHNPGNGKMLVYKMRQDSFVSFVSENKEEESSVSTREKVWHGGEVHINLKAKKATVAVFDSCESENVGGNILGMAKPIEGYGHRDCIAFSGDSVDWVPRYKNNKKIEELKGKTIVFEIKFSDGEVFSLSGNYTDVYNTQAARYRKFGILHE